MYFLIIYNLLNLSETCPFQHLPSFSLLLKNEDVFFLSFLELLPAIQIGTLTGSLTANALHIVARYTRQTLT
jgi:hypothetical protein